MIVHIIVPRYIFSASKSGDIFLNENNPRDIIIVFVHGRGVLWVIEIVMGNITSPYDLLN
jgi:hypothetical protein